MRMRRTMLAGLLGGLLLVMIVGASVWVGFGFVAVADEAASSPLDPKAVEMAREKAEMDARKEALTKPYPSAPGSRLAKIAPLSVKKMQIFPLRRVGSDLRRESPEPPLSPQAIAAVLKHCASAAPREKRGGKPPADTHSLIVELTDGAAFEIRYYQDLDYPFSDLESRDLKDVLHALTHESRASVVHFDEGKVLGVIDVAMPPLGTGGMGTKNYSARLGLDEAGRLTCAIRLFENRTVVMDDVKPMSYGSATTFAHKGKGHRIVLLHRP